MQQTVREQSGSCETRRRVKSFEHSARMTCEWRANRVDSAHDPEFRGFLGTAWLHSSGPAWTQSGTEHSIRDACEATARSDSAIAFRTSFAQRPDTNPHRQKIQPNTPGLREDGGCGIVVAECAPGKAERAAHAHPDQLIFASGVMPRLRHPACRRYGSNPHGWRKRRRNRRQRREWR